MKFLYGITGAVFWLAEMVSAGEAVVAPTADKIECAVRDRQEFSSPDCVRLTGWVGTRVAGNAANRLVKIDTDRLLEGYRQRPGRQAWDGEHVGKWLHAASLAWANSGDPALRQRAFDIGRGMSFETSEIGA